MERERRALAIQLQVWCQGEYTDWVDFPYLFTVLEDGLPLDHPDRKFWHGQGPSYQSIKMDHARVLHDYGLVVEWGRIEVEHARKWPPEKILLGGDMIRCPGWVAPNGDYYPCVAWGHDGVAGHISLCVMGKYTTRLEDHGWVLVGKRYTSRGVQITERQRTTLDAVANSEILRRPGIPEWQIDDDGIQSMMRLVRQGE